MRLTDQTSAQHCLVTWSEWHAIIILAGVFLTWFFLPVSFFSLWALVSFIVLTIYCRHFWTPKQKFGLANGITAFRLAGIVGLLLFPDSSWQLIIFISILVLIMDGMDGYVARKMKLASEFGEYFDKEVDALFMLSLCLLLYTREQYGSWILLPGVMRYIFVLYVKLAKPPQHKEYQTSFSKWIFLSMMLTLILDFTLYPQLAFPLTIAMTALLGYSFIISIWRFYHS